ncbi:MAG: hypothetical protein FJ035_07865 [Chloroflexi bacterium]|nr:hypothetical protein [Chloroflexota bacterium]
MVAATTTPAPGGLTATASASPSTIARGATVNIAARITSATARSVLVDVEVYGPGGRVHQRV